MTSTTDEPTNAKPGRLPKDERSAVQVYLPRESADELRYDTIRLRRPAWRIVEEALQLWREARRTAARSTE